MFRALRWVGEADENTQRKAGPGKKTWNLYCTSTGALQEPLKVTVSTGLVRETKDDPNSLYYDTKSRLFTYTSWNIFLELS